MDKFEKTKKLVDKYVQKGYNRGAIRRTFIKAGYDKNIIEKILDEKIKRNYKWEGAVVVIIAVIILILFLFNFKSDCDVNCFYEKANACEYAEFEMDVEGSTLLIVSNGCTLTKQFSSFSSDEPPELVALLEGQEMACPYEQNGLDIEWISLVEGIEDCDGGLKDILLELRLAQLELS